MFRTTSCVSNIKTLLFCRRPRDYQIAPITRLPPNYASYDPRPRKSCPLPPPPAFPRTARKDDRWLWGGLAVLLIAGFGIICAHDSPEIRDWLTLYAPWMDDFIAILYQENFTYGELAIQCMIDIKQCIDKLHWDGEKQCYPDSKSVSAPSGFLFNSGVTPYYWNSVELYVRPWSTPTLNKIVNSSKQNTYTLTFMKFCHRSLLDYRIASITCFPPQYMCVVKPGDPKLRKPCIQQPHTPPQKPPKDDKWVWLAMTALLLTGIGIVTAKNSPEIRDWMTLYAPWVDDLIAVLYEENYTYGEMAVQWFEDLTGYVGNVTNDKQIKECGSDGKPVADVPAEPPKEELATEEEGGVVCAQPLPPIVTQDICDIEHCIKELGEFAINNYNTGRDACAYYNKLVDETMENFTIRDLKKLRLAKKERKGLVKESLKNAKHAIGRLDDMYRYLDCGVQATKEEIENTKLLHLNFKQLYKAARIKFEWANDISIAKDKQWQMVEAVVDKYTDEIEAMYPGLKYSVKRPQFSGDGDILLYSVYRYVNQLTDELDDAAATLSERVNRAYEMLPGDKDVWHAREKETMALYAVKKAELVKEFNDRYAAQKANNDKLLKTLLQKQLTKHEELVKKRVAQKEAEIQGKLNDMVTTKVEAEKRVFAAQLANMAHKLEIVQAKLDVRLKAEKDTRRSQKLWAAASSLLAATRKGGPCINVNRELDAIEKASDGEDKLVLTVLKSIPSSVREKGIIPESMLKEKYKIMEDTALKVALVEEDGGPMPVYILSWLQALLLFMKISGIPQNEFEKPPKEPSEFLDTFDLLQRARFWMERGNLAMTLRYVDKLKGASRLAAHHWYECARAHLEVKQAAEAVLAHAAALGLQYI